MEANQPQVTLEFSEEFAVLQSALHYANKAIVGGLVNFEGVNGQLIRLITQPLEDLFIQQGSAVTARKLPKGQQSSTISAVNALKLRILYVLMMKSGLLRENQVYSAITKDLVELSTACTFQIVDICNLYPQFFMILSNSGTRCVPIYSELISHVQLWPQEKQCVVMGRLAEQLFLSDASPLLYKLGVPPLPDGNNNESQDEAGESGKAIQDKGLLKNRVEMCDKYTLLNSCLQMFESCSFSVAMETECTAYEVQIFLGLCAMTLCIGQGFTPTLKCRIGDPLVVDEVKFTKAVSGDWSEEELEEMYQSVMATKDFAHMASVCDLSVYEEQVLTVMEMIIEHVQDRIQDFTALAKKGWVIREESVDSDCESRADSLEGAFASVSLCGEGQQKHWIPVCFTDALLQQTQAQPGKMMPLRIRESVKKLACEFSRHSALDDEQKLAVNMFRVDERMPGAEDAILDVVRCINLPDAMNCAAKNVDLLGSFEAITVLVRTLFDFKNRGIAIDDGAQLLLEAFGKLPAPVQVDLLWNLYGNYEISDLFTLDDDYTVQLTAVFNMLTEEDYEHSFSQIGVLAMQSPERTLRKIVDVAVASYKQQTLLHRALLELKALCYLKRKPTEPSYLLQIISQRLEEGFLGQKEEENFIAFVEQLMKPGLCLNIPYSTQRITSLLPFPTFLDHCLLPQMASLLSKGISPAQSSQLHACVSLVAVNWDWGWSNDQMTCTLMLLTLARVVNACIVTWRMADPLVTEVKDIAVDVIRRFVPVLRKKVNLYPDEALEWLWTQMQGLHWTVPYYFYELAWSCFKPLPWPSSLDLVASRKDIDLSFEVSQDDIDGLVRLLELLQLGIPLGEEVMCASVWTFPCIYTRLLNAVVQVLPVCSYREMGHIAEILCTHINAGWLVVETESVLPAVEGLEKGSCMKLQVAQLLNDMLWTARNAYITGDEDIMAHIAKGIYALYQKEVIARLLDSGGAGAVGNGNDSSKKKGEQTQRKPTFGFLDAASSKQQKTSSPLSKASSQYILAHCYVQIARQGAHLGNYAAELRHTILLEIAKEFVKVTPGLSKVQNKKSIYTQLLATMVKATSEIDITEQMVLLKTLAWEGLKERQKSLDVQNKIIHELNSAEGGEVKSEKSPFRRWKDNVETTSAKNASHVES